jgi:lysylphosphatidylglycerol synthetase-like protein (DUF2156 family)
LAALTPPARAVKSSSPPLQFLSSLAQSAPRGNGYLALEEGLSSFIRKENVLTFRQSGSSVFAVGGMFGPQQGCIDLLRDFREECLRKGVQRALLFPVAENEREMLRQAGFDSIHVGSEAILDPGTFTLVGRKRSGLRYMNNRAKREGISFHELTHVEAIECLPDLLERWRRGLSSVQMRLVLGTACLDRPLGRRYFVACGGNHQPVAAITLTPGWSGGGWALDLLIREREAPPGAIDGLLIHTIKILAEEGVRCFSLGACPMSEYAAIGSGDRKVMRAIFRLIYSTRIGDSLFHFKGLARFKAKFLPHWQPVYIGVWPKVSIWSLYEGCRMWGLFGDDNRIFH